MKKILKWIASLRNDPEKIKYVLIVALIVVVLIEALIVMIRVIECF